ncbi:hypothetical protein QW180_08680 [Vibrio sinaloensis]|nr:hypothetical protein [Vibrio sinaloensis]
MFNEGVTRTKPEVLAQGSISGVDTKRFIFNPVSRPEIRQQLGIKETDVLFFCS